MTQDNDYRLYLEEKFQSLQDKMSQSLENIDIKLDHIHDVISK